MGEMEFYILAGFAVFAWYGTYQMSEGHRRRADELGRRVWELEAKLAKASKSQG